MSVHLATNQRAVEERAASQRAIKPDRWRSLCELARCGDADAFGEICERVRPRLLQLAQTKLGKDLHAKIAAADIVQTSLLEALGGFDHFAGEDEADFLAWIQRIVNNNLIDVARHYRGCEKRCTAREVPIDEAMPGQQLMDRCRTASSIVRHRETDEELLRFVARLPERRRRVVELRFRQGMTHAEIAKQLQITEVAARKILSRAVEQLRSMLAGQADVVRPNRTR